METYTASLTECGLFAGIPDIDGALRYLHARQREFLRGEFILHIGDRFACSGVVLGGEIECSYQDEAFNKYNMNHFTAGELFGEAMACADVASSPMQVAAVTDCTIMFLDFSVFCGPAKYEHQARLSGNLLRILAGKNLFLNQKVRILSCRELRRKILMYLQTLTPNDDGSVILPFSKAALAEFLCVNRTALSRELSRMQSDGLLSMDGRRFTLR